MTDATTKISSMERWVSIMTELIKQEEYRKKQRQELGYDIRKYFHSQSEDSKNVVLTVSHK